ncbi:hypothetical protein Cni_G27613 [Canna indica]|uniref:Tyrosinase copper-binding domain-containing protein n=1 Tax=Canna indica TaxID=4628 RepID=A0AAQ3QN42_9LILI|nr:hypothetical protein Cni_G27613 [Canna indica]
MAAALHLTVNLIAPSNSSSFACTFPGRRPRVNPKISCKGSDHHELTDAMIERRDVLVGLGAAAGFGIVNKALGSPIEGPDLSTCFPATPVPPCTVKDSITCCIPYTPDAKITDFKLPPRESPLRIRRAAHLVDSEYVAKYAEAVKLMKELPADDPRNFMQQANVHCAYCDGAYRQIGFPDLDIQVHGSWIFFPWHRFYLYFHERILGKLINDDTFALPFWNWDAPNGMRLPSIYNSSSSLFDELRDPNHQPPVLIDLDYSKTNETDISDDQLILHNLCVMHRQMISGAKTPSLFMGGPYVAGPNGDSNAGQGTIETTPHSNVHAWTGGLAGCNEDMGNLYSTARDPVFYAHHSNVDRMWYLWKKLDRRHRDFDDSDWLDAGFLFYDENGDLVRVRVKDCLETEWLRYAYQDVEIPWQKKQRAPVLSAKQRAEARSIKAGAEAKFPATLGSPVSATVKRPRGQTTEEEEEVLIVEGIEIEPGEFVKFDVLVNATETDGITPAASELAGSFVNVPRAHRKEKKMKMSLSLGISDLLGEIGADGDESILVTIVPRAGADKVTVGGLRIDVSK